jgi:hypothetical protein
MKKVFGISALVFVGLCLLVLPVLAFAGDQGVAGNYLLELLGKLIKNDPLTVAIMGAVVLAVHALIRVILKKIPGGEDGPIGKVIWWIATVLFGKGVVMSGNTDMEFVKKELVKEYPLLKIDIKKVADGTYK